MKKLAYYTCYFGNRINHSRLIPPLPSIKYDSYYFTNDIDIYNSLEKTSWKRILCNNVPVHDCNIKNTMETKILRACPHKFDILNDYEYLCWFDSKLKLYENKIEELMTQLSNNKDKIIVLSKHPCSNKFKSVWDEFNLAMEFDRYYLQKEQNINYIEKQIKNGFSEKISIHFCGGWSLRKKCEKLKEFNEEWYSHILECGIEDQISLQFVQQKYIDYIIPVEYQETWKYFYD